MKIWPLIVTRPSKDKTRKPMAKYEYIYKIYALRIQKKEIFLKKIKQINKKKICKQSNQKIRKI